MIALDWMDCYYVADAAAQLLSDWRPSSHPKTDSEVRSLLRSSAVATLRALWKSGSREARGLVIARVSVWCRHIPGEDAVANSERIRRIEARVLGPKLKEAA